MIASFAAATYTSPRPADTCWSPLGVVLVAPIARAGVEST